MKWCCLLGQPSSTDCVVLGPRKAFEEQSNPARNRKAPKSHINPKLELWKTLPSHLNWFHETFWGISNVVKSLLWPSETLYDPVAFCRTQLFILRKSGLNGTWRHAETLVRSWGEVEYKRQITSQGGKAAETDNRSSGAGLTSVESYTDDQISACFGAFLIRICNYGYQLEASRKSSLGLNVWCLICFPGFSFT